MCDYENVISIKDLTEIVNKVIYVSRNTGINFDNVINHVLAKYYLNMSYEDFDVVRDTMECLEGIGRDTNITVLLKIFREVYQSIEEAFLTCNGITYSSIEDAKKARNEQIRFKDLIYSMDVNDESSILKVKDIIKNDFSMGSKDDYAQFLDNILLQYDLQMRTVFGRIYENREQAEKIQSRIKTLNELINEISSYKDNEIVCNIVEYVKETDMAEEKKEEYLEYCNSLIKLFDYIQSLMDKEPFNDRHEISNYMYELKYASLLYKKYGFAESSFIDFADEYIKRETTVMDTAYSSILEADLSYVHCLENAHTYYNNVVKENTTKKNSIFGKLKDGVKKTFSKIFDADYQYITNKGTSPLPPISSFTFDDARRITHCHKNKIEEANNMTPIDRKNFYNWDFNTGKLGTVSVLKEDKVIRNDDVMKIFEAYEVKQYL